MTEVGQVTATTGSATYVYGVTRPDIVALTDLRGVAERPVRLVAADVVTALVSTVDLDEFGEEALRGNLEQLAWLEAVARAHHHVVSQFAAMGPVVPFRLATIYLDDDRTRLELGQRRDELSACLERIDGRTEWLVKVRWEPPPDPTQHDGGAPERPGTAFLQRRKAARAGREHDLQAAGEQVERLYAALGAVSVAGCRHAPQPPQLTNDTREMLLNAAYLIEGDDGSALAKVVAEHDEPALHVEFDGPWVPYSFATLEAGR